MHSLKPSLLYCGCLFAVSFFPAPIFAQTIPAAQWINASGQNGAQVLNTNGVFVTTFKTPNDLTVQGTNPASDLAVTEDIFGGSNPGNNPAYLTQYIGQSSNGTGDGAAGDVGDLNMTTAAAGTLQFDFANGLTPNDRILFVDVDGPEEYLLTAYVLSGTNYVQSSTSGWIAQDFSGTTGEDPNSQWPIWNGGAGTLDSGTSADLDEELVILTPTATVNRLVVTKQNGSGWSTDVTFMSLAQALQPIPLSIALAGTNAVLTWTNAAFTLQAAPAIGSAYTNVSGAASPYTNAVTGAQQFFRLIAY